MSNALNIIPKYTQEAPFLFRAAAISVCRNLNFSIASLVTAKIRLERGIQLTKQAEEEAKAGMGLEPDAKELIPTIDDANDEIADKDEDLTRNTDGSIDKSIEPVNLTDEQREAQGFTPPEDPMKLAAKLKIVRDSLAKQLYDHASLKFTDNGISYRNPWDLAPPLEQELERQLKRQPTVNMAAAQAEADAHGIPVEDIVRVRRSQVEAGLRFLRDNRKELMDMLHSLVVHGPTGHARTLEEAEQVEETLPVIDQARIYQSIDRGLWFERDRWINNLLRRHPEASTNLKLIDGERAKVHKAFEWFMTKPAVKIAVYETVERGAAYPVLTDLPTKAKAAA